MTPKEKAPQTAVEWLVDQLEKHYVKVDIKNTAVFYQAKEMEKQQIMDAYRFPNTLLDISAEQYYNETFNK
jgi:hypothetical protein